MVSQFLSLPEIIAANTGRVVVLTEPTSEMIDAALAAKADIVFGLIGDGERYRAMAQDYRSEAIRVCLLWAVPGRQMPALLTAIVEPALFVLNGPTILQELGAILSHPFANKIVLPNQDTLSVGFLDQLFTVTPEGEFLIAKSRAL